MGRKIPGCKHHGTKDPDKQRRQREEKIKNKINQRPKDIDSQEMPRKMRELFNPVITKKKKHPKNRNKDELKSTAKFINREQQPLQRGMDKPLRPIPVFNQNPGESKNNFYRRMHQTIVSMRNQRDYEEKYKVKVVQDEHGNSKLEDAEPDILDEGGDNNKNKNKKKKKDNVDKVKRIGKKERRRQKLKGNSGEKDFDDFKDVAEFGEVVHAPPKLQFKIKNPEEKMSASKVDGLLLKQKFQPKTGKKEKIPKVSMARQVILEKERQRVVEAYRAMKDRAF